MKSREEWLKDLARRQDNIDPIRRIPNGAMFYGTLINGSARLNGIQRVGAFALGLSGVVLGCFGLAGLAAAIRSHDLSGFSAVMIFSPLSLWFGCKIAINALMNNPEKRRKRR